MSDDLVKDGSLKKQHSNHTERWVGNVFKMYLYKWNAFLTTSQKTKYNDIMN